MTDPVFAPDDAEARRLFAQGAFAEAEPFFRRHLAANPRNAVAHYNLGVTLAKLDRPEEAIASYRAALDLNPSFADAFANLGFCLCELGLIAQARQGFALARQLAPMDPVPTLNEGIAALTLGDYEAGWRGFDARWQLPDYAKFRRDFPGKEIWRGQPLTGKTLFVYTEQGFGDAIQMARLLPPLVAASHRIVLETPPALARLFASLSPAPIFIGKDETPPDFDYYCAMMDLPYALNLRAEAIPTPIPYLAADAAEVEACRRLWPRTQAKRVGLSWAGRSTHQNDRKRSLALAQFEPLLARRDIEWLSLQRVVPPRDKALLDDGRLVNWGESFADFAATAAAMETLDLVITVDTALAHLAGALGKPVWVLLPFYPDWRWFMGREDSPWYPSARLFRQKKRGDWGEVIARVAAAL